MLTKNVTSPYWNCRYLSPNVACLFRLVEICGGVPSNASKKLRTLIRAQKKKREDRDKIAKREQEGGGKKEFDDGEPVLSFEDVNNDDHVFNRKPHEIDLAVFRTAAGNFRKI